MRKPGLRPCVYSPPTHHTHKNTRRYMVDDRDTGILGTTASSCPLLIKLTLEGYELSRRPAAPLAHVTRLEVCNARHLTSARLSDTFPKLAALRRHGYCKCAGWAAAASGHAALHTLELDLRGLEARGPRADEPAAEDADQWLEAAGQLMALASLGLTIDTDVFVWTSEFESGSGECLKRALSHLRLAAQLTRLDLTAEMGLPLRYLIVHLGDSLAVRLRCLRVAGGEVPAEAAAVQLFPLVGTFPRLADLDIAVPPVEARVMQLMQPLGALLTYCPALETLCLEAGELDTGRAGLRRVRARCAALSARGTCKMSVV